MSQPWINGGMRVKIEQIKDLLGKLPLTSSVSITRPADLAKELFTHKGSGTLVRRGESVLRATSWDELDLPRLRTLIESSFGRTLLPDYFETVSYTHLDVYKRQLPLCSTQRWSTSRHWCLSTPAIRRAPSVPTASSATCAKTCPASRWK